MKTKLSLLLLGLIFLLANNSFAQQEWEWKTHGIAFTTSSKISVSENNERLFQAENEKISLSIAPWQGEMPDDEAIANALVKLASDMDYDDITDARILNFDSFSGYGINGTKDGNNAAIVILLNTLNNTNIVIVIAYLPEAENEASSILTSLHTIK